MTKEEVFDRPRLVASHVAVLSQWAESLLDILRRRQNDSDPIWLTEDIIALSLDAGLPLRQSCFHSGGATSGDLARTLRFDYLSEERTLFTFEPDCSGVHSAIEKMENLKESLEGERPEESRLALMASHAIAVRTMRRSNKLAMAIDPIALRILDRITDSEMAEFLSRRADIALWLEEPEEGRGLRHFNNPEFGRKLDERLPEMCVDKEGAQHRSEAFGYFTFQRRLDVIQAKTQKHENGSLRGSTIFIEQDLPHTMRAALAGRLLDDVVVTPPTEGLGLVIREIEDASKGIAIHTNADEMLTVIERNIG